MILGAIGCGDDNPILEEPSHRVIFTSEMDFENTIEVEGVISFGDVSAGVESRIWTFPEGVVDIIDSDNDVTSSEGNVITTFNEVGIFDVKLSQVFKEDAFVGETQQGRELDTTIVVTVLPPVKVDFEAYYLNDDGSVGSQLNIAANAMNEIPAAKSVRFVWTGEGEPRFISWDFVKAAPVTFTSMDSIVDVKYKFLGTFDLTVAGNRSRPIGGDTLMLENFINVIPSTDPVLLEEIYDKEGKIAISFGRELDASTLEDADFTVEVKNKGEVITSSFSSLTLDPDEGNIVIMDLGGEQIYNDDSISISFVSGNLTSLDGVQSTEFEEKLLEFRKVNILETNSNFDYDFETSSDIDWVLAENWGPEWDKFTLEIDAVEVQSGQKSAYIEIEALGNMTVEQRDIGDEYVQFPANSTKTYEVGSWIYVVDAGSTPATALQPDLRFYWKLDDIQSINNAFPNPEINADFPTNQWVYSSNFVKFDETGDYHFEIRGFNAANPEMLRFYLDNIILAEVQLRP